jgi:biopolymer transport protein ExbD
MADIAFLLVIFFMVTSVFAATKGLELKLPNEDPPPDPEPEDAVFIRVRADAVLVDCRPMRESEIRAYLEPVLARNPDKPVILYAEPDARYGDMVAVYDALVADTNGPDGDSVRVKNVFIPTRRDIERYIEQFGGNPLQSACDGS